MRTLKFRAYSKKLGMSEPTDFKTLVSTATDFNEFDVYMQFTGLVDRHGMEIYEGDIVKVYDEVHEIVYGNGDLLAKTSNDIYPAFHFKPCDCQDSNELQNAVVHNICEVIGNIYENGELLAESEQENE